MTNKLLKLNVVFLLSLVFTEVQAQETVNTSGGTASGSGGTVSYSVGQVFYTYAKGNSLTVTQGVQQTYGISEVTGIKGTKKINISVSAYPNPTTDYLILSIADFDMSDLSYQLYDVNGKVLQNKKIKGSQTSIIMSGLVPAIYFVKITKKDELIKTFQIIKN